MIPIQYQLDLSRCLTLECFHEAHLDYMCTSRDAIILLASQGTC